MQINEVKPKHKPKGKKRIGRGGKKGNYSGKGMKGQSSRAGRKLVPIIRGIIKRYPKLRGYRAKDTSFKTVILNLDILEKNFKNSDNVNPSILIERHLIRRIKGKTPMVKILGKGELKKKLDIEKCEVSKAAKEKIEKAGGSIK